MKKGLILISLVERSEYIVNLAVYLFVDHRETKLLKNFEIMHDNIEESFAALHKLVSGHKIT